jgi:hypothetical protein
MTTCWIHQRRFAAITSTPDCRRLNISTADFSRNTGGDMTSSPAESRSAQMPDERKLVPTVGAEWRRGGLSSAVAVGLAGALAGGLLFLGARRGLGDDAYITLDYARNLALHGHWGVITSRTANTATSPLNVGMLAGITTVVRDPVWAVGLLLMATTAASAGWLQRIADNTGLSRWQLPMLGVALLLSSPLLSSTVGLETYLGIALFVGLVRYALVGRWLAAGIVAGLLILTRPDLAVVDIAVVFTVAAARRRALRSALIAVAVAAPWHVFSWFVFGSALPDTFAVKTDTGSGGWVGFHFTTGPVLYLWYWPVAAGLTVLSGVLGVVALVAGTSVAVRRGGLAASPAWQAAVSFGLGGAANAAVFAFLASPPSHWYYGPLVAGLNLCAAVTALVVAQRYRARGSRCVLALGLVTLIALAEAGFDVARGVPWEAAPMRTNWATTQEYQRIAEDLSKMKPGSVVESPAEVGTLAYFCDCQVVDFISDPGRTEQFIARREQQAGPLARKLLGLNHLHRASISPVPAEYQLVWEKASPNGAGQWPATYTTSGRARHNRMRLIPAG